MNDGHLQLISAILETSTLRAAAERAEISEATLYRRLAERDFQARLQEARHQAFGQSLARLQAASGSAVDCLTNVMGSEAAPAGVRVRAAIALLELSSRDMARGDVQTRLDTNSKEDALLRGDEEAFKRAGGSPSEYFATRAARGLFD